MSQGETGGGQRPTEKDGLGRGIERTGARGTLPGEQDHPFLSASGVETTVEE